MAAATFVIAFAATSALGLRVNASPSLPLGLYQATSTNSGLVEFCPDEPAASVAIKRGYRQGGSCPDGAAPLLKPIVAQAGDVVRLSENGIEVNEHHLPNTAPLSADTAARPLVHWPYGTYLVKAGELWVASTYNARSFDSRYFGPIRESVIRSRVRPVLVLK